MPRTISLKNKTALGKVIALRLKDMGKTLKWLAEDAGVDPICLCAVTAGRSNPTIKYLRKIANSLGIDVKDLVNALLSDK